MHLVLKAVAQETATLELEPGVTLVGRQHHKAKGINEWVLKGPYVDGYVSLDFYSDIPFPSINTIWTEPKGIGWGKMVVRALVNHFGGLTSDPQGNTSDAAVAMWESLKAEKISTPRCVKGYYYQLRK